MFVDDVGVKGLMLILDSEMAYLMDLDLDSSMAQSRVLDEKERAYRIGDLRASTTNVTNIMITPW